jgi:hypothetical protein
MAISRHDPQWKRVVFMALAGGATFSTIIPVGRRGEYAKRVWHAYLPDGKICSANSKYGAALSACYLMGADASILPDAATPQTAPSGPDGNRTEEFTC